jgi:hypothetical protein
VFGRKNAVVDLLASILDSDPDSLGLILGVPSQVGLAKKRGGREEGWGKKNKNKRKTKKPRTTTHLIVINSFVVPSKNVRPFSGS